LKAELDLDAIRDEYAKAVRAWHVAWLARVDWHANMFNNIEERSRELLYDHAWKERESLRVAEERAYERVLAARDILAEALRTAGN
jgi:hypothetical protein